MPPRSPSLAYRLLRFTFWSLCCLLGRLDIRGFERTPPDGPLLVVFNHLNSLDPPIILAFLPRHPVTVVSKAEYKSTWVAGLVRIVGGIYIKRGEVDRQALREMRAVLEGGGMIGIAPEGTRSRTGQLQEGHEGVAYIALQSDAWILPIGIWGHEQALAHFRRLRRPLVSLRVGEPFKLSSEPSLSRKQNVQAGTRRIMLAIAALLPPPYRGVYAHESAESLPDVERIEGSR